MSASAAGDSVTAPSGMNEGDVHFGETGHDVGFREGRVKTLVGNAVSVKDDPVAVFKVKVGILGCL